MHKLRVTSIQRLCVHDGPGVRTTVFLKGCYLQCPWCCNPETISYDDDEYFEKNICIREKESQVCLQCVRMGGEHKIDKCPLNAYEKTYTDYGITELYELLMRDANLYKNDGGVTFSGGEPLMQAIALLPLIKALKKENVHVAFETTLYAPTEHLRAVVGLVDFYYVDLKAQFGFIKNNDYSLTDGLFADNLEIIWEQNAHFRMVVFAEFLNDVNKKTNTIQRLKDLGINEIELLCYHSLGKSKYDQLGKPFHEFIVPSKSQIHEFLKDLNRVNIKASVLEA